MKRVQGTSSGRSGKSPALFAQMAALGVRRSAPASINPIRSDAQFQSAAEHLSRRDKTLARLIRRLGPCELRPEKAVSPFAALAEAIIYQQLNGKAASAILHRVKALFPAHRFPMPEDFLQTPDNRLREAGLSRAKVAAIKDLSEKALAGVVPTSRAIARMPDEEILERLTTIRGIGRWTVEMLLIFKLGRPDVLPATDYGVRQGFARTFGRPELPKPADLHAHGERWRPYRTVAAWYLWRSLELPLEPKLPSRGGRASSRA